MFVLDHPAVASSIQLPDADFSYDADSQILTVVAPKNTVLTLSYDWYGEQTVIRSFAAGWIAA